MTERQLVSALLGELIILQKQKARLISALSKERHRASHAEQLYIEVLRDGSQPRDKRMEAYSQYAKEGH